MMMIEEQSALYAIFAVVLILKMMALSWFTGRVRVSRQVIHSEEDRMWMQKPNVILCPKGGGHPDVDLIRRVHLHDLKIVVPYLYVIPLWLNTIPAELTVQILFLGFALSNSLYTSLMFHSNSHSEIFHIAETIIVGWTCATTILHYMFFI